MVRNCYICKKTVVSHPDLSFHKFPSDTEKGYIWASLLGFETLDCTKKMIFICSTHFNPNDIGTRATGKKYLKPDAFPLPYHNAFESSPESTDTEQEDFHSSPPAEKRPINLKDGEALCECLSSSATLTASSPATLSVSSPSDTLTATEGENNLSDADFVEQSSQNVRRKKRRRGYFGDLSPSDFSTPEKRTQSFLDVKEIVSNQKKKIHVLQNKVRRQQTRIVKLKSMVCALRKKLRASEQSEFTILEIHDDDEEDPIQGDNISNTGEPQSKISKPNVELEKTLIEEEENPELRTFCDFIYQKMNSFDEATYNLVQHEIMQVISQAEETKFCNDIEISETNESFPSDIDIEHCKLEPEDIDETDICKYEIDIDESDSCMYTCKLETEEKVEGT